MRKTAEYYQSQVKLLETHQQQMQNKGPDDSKNSRNQLVENELDILQRECDIL